MNSVVRVLLKVCLLLPFSTFAQDDASTGTGGLLSLEPEISTLNSVSSPAFSILGLSPSAIARPVSPRELSATVLSSLADSSSNLPQNLAIEFSPYWWRSHPNLTFEKYIADNTRLRDLVRQTMSFSLASKDIESEGDSIQASTELALGVRFSLLKGKASKSTKDASGALSDAILTFVDNETCDEQEDEQLNAADGKSDVTIEYTGECKTQWDAIGSKSAVLVQKVRSSVPKRTGLQSDLSLAVSYLYPGNSSTQRIRSGTAGWLTLSYTPGDGSTGGLQYLAILRYLEEHNPLTLEHVDSFDVGARLLWNHESKPLALSTEYLNRTRDEGEDSRRYALTLEYRINASLSLVASYGKNFSAFDTDKDLFVSGGLTFNIGKGPILPKSLLTP